MPCKMRNVFKTRPLVIKTWKNHIQMDFNKVHAATQNFDLDKKLGEGGFRDVMHPGRCWKKSQTSVVVALSGKSVDLPAPTLPNFFNISYSVSVTSGSTSATTSTTITMGTSHSSLLPILVDD